MKSPAYGWKSTESHCAHEYFVPPVLDELKRAAPITGKVVDLGCGNGYLAGQIAALGYRVWAVDESPDGLELARTRWPQVTFIRASTYDEALASEIPTPVDCVVSTEVIEHLLYPRAIFQRASELLAEGGTLILTTPYHGYLKNLAMSLLDGWDRHFNVHWEGGHVKFFSNAALSQMAAANGFRAVRFLGAGRLPWFWKSTVMVAEKLGD